ncbi:MAG: hypothetical protein PHE25_00600 [Candidatus Gracilibacteria bacterium]|nr:hypothetical protein [Candidatus Gracilibacteria bacterium]
MMPSETLAGTPESLAGTPESLAGTPGSLHLEYARRFTDVLKGLEEYSNLKGREIKILKITEVLSLKKVLKDGNIICEVKDENWNTCFVDPSTMNKVDITPNEIETVDDYERIGEYNNLVGKYVLSKIVSIVSVRKTNGKTVIGVDIKGRKTILIELDSLEPLLLGGKPVYEVGNEEKKLGSRNYIEVKGNIIGSDFNNAILDTETLKPFRVGRNGDIITKVHSEYTVLGRKFIKVSINNEFRPNTYTEKDIILDAKTLEPIMHGEEYVLKIEGHHLNGKQVLKYGLSRQRYILVKPEYLEKLDLHIEGYSEPIEYFEDCPGKTYCKAVIGNSHITVDKNTLGKTKPSDNTKENFQNPKKSGWFFGVFKKLLGR